jgi:hypothetical protein
LIVIPTEKAPMFVIPSEARNPSLFNAQEKRDSSARSAPRFTENVLRERNDNVLSFSATCLAAGGPDNEMPHKLFSLRAFCAREQRLKNKSAQAEAYAT